jgi:hypothetical protein
LKRSDFLRVESENMMVSNRSRGWNSLYLLNTTEYGSGTRMDRQNKKQTKKNNSSDSKPVQMGLLRYIKLKLIVKHCN